MVSIIIPIVSLASVFMDMDICTIAEKQKEEKATKKIREYLPFTVSRFSSLRKGRGDLSFLLCLIFAPDCSRSSVITGFFTLRYANHTDKSIKAIVESAIISAGTPM